MGHTVKMRKIMACVISQLFVFLENTNHVSFWVDYIKGGVSRMFNCQFLVSQGICEFCLLRVEHSD